MKKEEYKDDDEKDNQESSISKNNDEDGAEASETVTPESSGDQVSKPSFTVDEIKALFDPVRDQFSDGMDERGAITHLLGLHHAFNEDPRSLLDALGKEKGLSVEFHDNNLSPEDEGAFRKAHDEFLKGGDRKHLDTVVGMMSALLPHTGGDLGQAYENASWAHPDVRKQLLGDLQKSADVQKAKKAGGSLKSLSPSTVDEPPQDLNGRMQYELKRKKAI